MDKKEIFMLYPRLVQIGFQVFFWIRKDCNRKHCESFFFLFKLEGLLTVTIFLFLFLFKFLSCAKPGCLSCVFAATLQGKYLLLPSFDGIWTWVTPHASPASHFADEPTEVRRSSPSLVADLGTQGFWICDFGMTRGSSLWKDLCLGSLPFPVHPVYSQPTSCSHLPHTHKSMLVVSPELQMMVSDSISTSKHLWHGPHHPAKQKLYSLLQEL